MKVMKEVTRIQESVDKYVCNKCANEMKDEPWGLNGAECAYFPGYGTEHFVDGSHISWDLCESCLVEIFKTFKVEPTVEE